MRIDGDTVLDVLNQLNEHFPGIKFRFIDEQEQIRSHMNIFVNKKQISDLHRALENDDELFIVQALSGG